MKKIFILAFIVLPIKLLFANDLLNDVVYNGNLVLLENLIKPQQLMNFQLEELRILRNMIYAKYDYRFRSNDLQEYFSQFEWYNGTEDNVEKYLTTLDYINIRTIQSLEDEYPFIIPYNDERIYNLENFGHYRYYNNFRYRISENELVLMGWSPDGHLFVARSSYDGMDGVRVYNLKENKIVWYGLDQNYNSAYTRDDSYRRTIDETIEIAERRYNIMPTAEYTLITIEGYSLYSKEIMNQPEDHLYGTTYLEIGLKNNSNNKTIKVGAISNLPRIYRRPYNGSVSESDILYLCVRSPYDENIAALIVIRPAIRGGDSDGPVTYYNIFGIDLNGLYE